MEKREKDFLKACNLILNPGGNEAIMMMGDSQIYLGINTFKIQLEGFYQKIQKKKGKVLEELVKGMKKKGGKEK